MVSSCQKCWQAPALSFQWGRGDWSRSVSDQIRTNQDKDSARNWMFWEEQRSYSNSCAKISKKSWIYELLSMQSSWKTRYYDLSGTSPWAAPSNPHPCNLQGASCCVLPNFFSLLCIQDNAFVPFSTHTLTQLSLLSLFPLTLFFKHAVNLFIP